MKANRTHSKAPNSASSANGLIKSDSTKTSLLDIVVSPEKRDSFYALDGDFAKQPKNLWLSYCT